MKHAVILLIASFIIGFSFAQEAPHGRSETDSQFERYQKQIKSGDLESEYMNGIELGAVPPPSTLYFGKPKAPGSRESFDPYYDLRDHGLVTPVKPQSNNGCWAYATIGSVESRWLKLGLGTWDLSENNLKYCHGFVPERSFWGNHWMSTAYFARDAGPLAEADDPYPGGTTVPGDCPTGKTPQACIDQAFYLPNDMDVIKQAVLDYGAVYTMMYISSSYLNTRDYTYFYNGTPRVNHAVDIVGWDDNKVTAGGTGAWICKNSYGPSWGLSGYFYISYNDSSVLDYNAIWPERLDYDQNSNIYGYDITGHYYSTGYGTESGYALLKYTAPVKMRIDKLGTYAVATGENIQISIYQDFEDGVLSGHLADLPLINCAWPGYYARELSAPILIEEDQDYYLKIEYNTPGYTYPIPYECYIAGYSDPQIETGKCWISGDGSDGSWYSVGADNGAGWEIDLCAKVYATDMPAPYFSQQPSNTRVCLADSASLLVEVNGGSYQMQWQKNGVDISGANDSILNFSAASLADEALYRCLAYTDYDTAYSWEVQLDVLALPDVDLQFYTPVCQEAEAIRLRGGMPGNGTYSGAAVSNNIFDPATAGTGQHLITYTYTDASGCSDTAQAYLQVQQQNPAFSCGDSLSDTRDGKKYATLELGGKCWMKQNLNFGNRISGGQNQQDNGNPEKYCYDNQSDSCSKYGALYQWDELMAYQTTESCTGICPCGWHVPSKAEWVALFDAVAGATSKAAPHLLESGYTDFGLLLSGAAYGRNAFLGQADFAELWTSSQSDAIKAYSLHFSPLKASVNERKAGHQSSFYLRCIKND